LSGEFDARPQIVAFQIREFSQQIFKRIACHDIFQQGIDRIPQVSNAWFAMANLRVNRDTGQKLVHAYKHTSFARERQVSDLNRRAGFY
jgi:hypothetical protein